MKKINSIFLCLALSALFFLTGCNEKSVPLTVVNTVINNKAVIINKIVNVDNKSALAEISDEDYEGMAASLEANGLKFADKEVFVSAVNSNIAAENEAGIASQVMDDEDIVVSGNEEDGYKTTIKFMFEKREVNMNVAYDGDMNITDITFSPVYSMGEAMTKAALNTLLGMGSVFSVLVLIMCIIYLFGIIPKIQKASADKKAKKEKVSTEASVDKTIANIVEKEEGELVDDTELVAVISAAIAAYEGNGSADGFVVRSIRKSQSKKWQNAQY